MSLDTAVESGLTVRESLGQSVKMPFLRIALSGSKDWYSGLIDTGAGISVVNAEVLLAAGWSDEQVRTGAPNDLDGVGGKVPGWRHRISIQIRTPFAPQPVSYFRDLDCVVAFRQADDFLLGQLGFLQELKLIHDPPRNRLRIEP